RLGDPETQALMYSFEGDLAETLSGSDDASWKTPSICVVMSAQGYPDKPRCGDTITGISDAQNTGATVFHAGTLIQGENLVTNGGRVLGVTAAGSTLRSAMDSAYLAVDQIHFPGAHYRKDIGQKGLPRW
ncbi:MAG: phosphoribosylamine--glycine ligase, partial [Acidobacteriota bacterium]|nr:phosphoribosylamine--glycine ligase [Acidobacteriota bacterium]